MKRGKHRMIIFNLDGTLANCEHRRHLPDYESCDKDAPIQAVFDVLNSLLISPKRIQIWTGRCESVRDKTERWLIKHSIFNPAYPFELKMRPIGDPALDHEIKEKWLDEYLSAPLWPLLKPAEDQNQGQIIYRNEPIQFVFDDNAEVIRMWRRRKIFVFDCCQKER